MLCSKALGINIADLDEWITARERLLDEKVFGSNIETVEVTKIAKQALEE